MKLKHLREDEFDFLDTDEPVQHGEDDFGNYKVLQKQLEDFASWLDGRFYRAEWPRWKGHGGVTPKIDSNKQVSYWIGGEEDVTKQVRSHPYYTKEIVRPAPKGLEGPKSYPRVTIVTNLIGGGEDPNVPGTTVALWAKRRRGLEVRWYTDWD